MAPNRALIRPQQEIGIKMDEIEQYQSRIFAALDKVSAVVSKSGGRDQELARLHERDLALIEELEATLAEERADLEAERVTSARLKSQLDETRMQLEQARAAQEAAEARLKEAENARYEAEAALRHRMQEQDYGQVDTTGLEERIEQLTARINTQDQQFQLLKEANEQLRESNAILRERNLEMLPDPSAIDQSLKAELDALKAMRAADIEEMDAILDELKPLVEEKVNA